MNTDTPTSWDYQDSSLVTFQPDPVPVNTHALRVVPDETLVEVAKAIEHAVNVAILKAKEQGITILDCRTKWTNIPDHYYNPDAIRGFLRFSFLGRRIQNHEPGLHSKLAGFTVQEEGTVPAGLTDGQTPT
jgi:hypothetical protein